MALQDHDFFRKLVWAKHHLNELDQLIANYRATNPYRVTRHVEGTRKTVRWRLHITEAPPKEVALHLGDFLYNVRAGLDYLAGALVVSSERSHASFPILTTRVWDVPTGDEAMETRLRADRKRWAFIERTMTEDVINILKELHPPTEKPSRAEPMHYLRILNALSNKDRHRTLSVVAAGLEDATTTVKVIFPDGTDELLEAAPVPKPVRRAFADGAQILAPPRVVDVEATGSVAVIVDVGAEWTYVLLPNDMRMIWENACKVGGLLEPHVRG